MLAITGTTSRFGWARRSSTHTKYSVFSARSSSTIRRGWNRATCRASSDPIDPAPPVQRSPVRVPVVVDETHDVQLVPLVVQQLAEQLLTRFTGADDEGPFRLRCLCLHQGADLARDADGEPEAAD